MGSCASQKRGPKSDDSSHPSDKIYQISDFQLVRVIGRGGFGTVWMVKEKQTDRPYALKVMRKAKIIAKKSVKAALNERKILTCLMEVGAKGITNMLASFQDNQHLYILMDYLQGHSLRHHINSGLRLAEEQIRRKQYYSELTVYAILKILQQLQNHRIIHRDIKPENILFDGEGRPFLTDFGIACFATEDGADADSGTVGYMAPEVMLAQTHSFTADYYAVGVVAFELLFGRRPFKAASKEEMLRVVNRTVVDAEHFPELKKVSAEAAGFVAGLLQRRPRLRLGHSRGISELLQHPWFTTIHADSTDTIILHYIKSPLRHTQTSFSISVGQSSTNGQMGEAVIASLLNRDHIQEMFSNFDSLTIIPDRVRTRKLSEGVEGQSVSSCAKQSLNNSR